MLFGSSPIKFSFPLQNNVKFKLRAGSKEKQTKKKKKEGNFHPSSVS